MLASMDPTVKFGKARPLAALVAILFVDTPGLGADAIADTTVRQAPSDIPTYADVRTPVTVQRGPRIAPWNGPRPADFYQLAGAADPELCAKTLAAFNEPGTYRSDDHMQWLLDNSHAVEFRSLMSGTAGSKAPSSAPYVFPGLEYASVDLDADGKDEHVYRLNAVLSSQWHQELMIVPDRLQNHPELLGPYGQECTRVYPSDACDSMQSRIRYALTARVPERLPNEWAFTRAGALNRVAEDTVSRRLIFPQSLKRAERNVANASSSYWSLYRIASAVVVVAAPASVFAAPELMVFAPGRETAGALRCVIMPVAWHK